MTELGGRAGVSWAGMVGGNGPYHLEEAHLMMVLAATVVGSSLGFLTIKMFLGLLGDDEWGEEA